MARYFIYYDYEGLTKNNTFNKIFEKLWLWMRVISLESHSMDSEKCKSPWAKGHLPCLKISLVSRGWINSYGEKAWGHLQNSRVKLLIPKKRCQESRLNIRNLGQMSHTYEWIKVLIWSLIAMVAQEEILENLGGWDGRPACLRPVYKVMPCLKHNI